MSCTCGLIKLNGNPTGTRNWNPDCDEHGTGTAWYEHPAQVGKRVAAREHTRDLQLRAAAARREAQRPQIRLACPETWPAPHTCKAWGAPGAHGCRLLPDHEGGHVCLCGIKMP